MDSKNIFITSTTYLRKVIWEKQEGEEWIYIGIGKDFDSDKANQLVRSTLKTEEIYIVTDRHISRASLIEDLILELELELKAKSFLLWDSSFEWVVEFSHIGVARKGRRA
jgi:hypothetical protein